MKKILMLLPTLFWVNNSVLGMDLSEEPITPEAYTKLCEEVKVEGSQCDVWEKIDAAYVLSCNSTDISTITSEAAQIVTGLLTGYFDKNGKVVDDLEDIEAEYQAKARLSYGISLFKLNQSAVKFLKYLFKGEGQESKLLQTLPHENRYMARFLYGLFLNKEDRFNDAVVILRGFFKGKSGRMREEISSFPLKFHAFIRCAHSYALFELSKKVTDNIFNVLSPMFKKEDSSGTELLETIDTAPDIKTFARFRYGQGFFERKNPSKTIEVLAPLFDGEHVENIKYLTPLLRAQAIFFYSLSLSKMDRSLDALFMIRRLFNIETGGTRQLIEYLPADQQAISRVLRANAIFASGRLEAIEPILAPLFKKKEELLKKLDVVSQVASRIHYAASLFNADRYGEVENILQPLFISRRNSLLKSVSTEAQQLARLLMVRSLMALGRNFEASQMLSHFFKEDGNGTSAFYQLKPADQAIIRFYYGCALQGCLLEGSTARAIRVFEPLFYAESGAESDVYKQLNHKNKALARFFYAVTLSKIMEDEKALTILNPFFDSAGSGTPLLAELPPKKQASARFYYGCMAFRKSRYDASLNILGQFFPDLIMSSEEKTGDVDTTEKEKAEVSGSSQAVDVSVKGVVIPVSSNTDATVESLEAESESEKPLEPSQAFALLEPFQQVKAKFRYLASLKFKKELRKGKAILLNLVSDIDALNIGLNSTELFILQELGAQILESKESE